MTPRFSRAAVASDRFAHPSGYRTAAGRGQGTGRCADRSRRHAPAPDLPDRCRSLDFLCSFNDAKLHVAKQNAYYYPDVMVSCATTLQALSGSEIVVDAPVLVVEVPSPSTEGTDRREKLLAYRTLPRLKEYVLIAQDRAEIEIHSRLSETSWEITTLTPGDPVILDGVDLVTDFPAVYEEACVEL